MGVEIKNEILNLEHSYGIVLSESEKNILYQSDGLDNISDLLGIRSHNALFSTQRNYDFTKYFEGGRM